MYLVRKPLFSSCMYLLYACHKLSPENLIVHYGMVSVMTLYFRKFILNA